MFVEINVCGQPLGFSSASIITTKQLGIASNFMGVSIEGKYGMPRVYTAEEWLQVIKYELGHTFSPSRVPLTRRAALQNAYDILESRRLYLMGCLLVRLTPDARLQEILDQMADAVRAVGENILNPDANAVVYAQLKEIWEKEAYDK